MKSRTWVKFFLLTSIVGSILATIVIVVWAWYELIIRQKIYDAIGTGFSGKVDSINIEKIRLSFPDKMVFMQVDMEKEGGAVMCLDEVFVDLDLFSLLFGHERVVEQIRVSRGSMFLSFEEKYLSGELLSRSLAERLKDMFQGQTLQIQELLLENLSLYPSLKERGRKTQKVYVSALIKDVRSSSSGIEAHLVRASTQANIQTLHWTHIEARIRYTSLTDTYHLSKVLLQSPNNYVHLPFISVSPSKQSMKVFVDSCKLTAEHWKETLSDLRTLYSFTDTTSWQAIYSDTSKWAHKPLVFKGKMSREKNTYFADIQQFSIKDILHFKGALRYHTSSEEDSLGGYNVKVLRLRMDPYSFATFSPIELPKGLEILEAEGEVTGDRTYVQVKCSLQSNLGEGDALINMQKQSGTWQYKAVLTLRNGRLSHYAWLPEIEDLTLEAHLSKTSASHQLEAHIISAVVAQQIPIENIHIKGQFLDTATIFQVSSHTPTLQFYSHISLKKAASDERIEVHIPQFYMQAIAFPHLPVQSVYINDLTFKTSRNSIFKGLGRLRIQHLKLRTSYHTLTENNVSLYANFQQDYTLHLQTSTCSFMLSSSANLRPTFQTIYSTYKHLIPIVLPNPGASRPSITYRLEGHANLSPLMHYISLVYGNNIPQFSSESQITFLAAKDKFSRRLLCTGTADTITITELDMKSYQNKLSISYTQKPGQLEMGSFKQRAVLVRSLSNHFSLKEPFIDTHWEGKVGGARIGFGEEMSANYASILIRIHKKDLNWEFLLSPSTFVLDHMRWTSVPGGHFSWSPKERWHIDSLAFTHMPHILQLRGNWSPKGGKLEVQGSVPVVSRMLKKFNVPLKGTVVGRSTLQKTAQGLLLQAQIQSSDLQIFEQPLGRTSVHAAFDFKDALKFKVLVDSADASLSLEGMLTRAQQLKATSLRAHKVPLKLFTPLIERDFSGISGTLGGELTFSGSIYDPDIYGEIKIHEGRALFDYMQTNLYYQGSLQLSGKKILLQNLEVEDEQGQPIQFRGMVVHHGFEALEVFASVSLENVHVLNTYTLPLDGNYYGQAYVSGELNVRGTLEDLYFSGKISSQPGTYIYGLYVDEEALQTSLIEFTSLSDMLRTMPRSDQLDRVLAYKLEVELDNHSYIALISSPEADPSLIFTGQGRVDIERTREQQYILHGTLQLSKGKYSFSSGLLQKKFDILAGSSLSWQGAPSQPTLSLSMRYREQVSISPIATFSTTSSSSNTYIDAQVDMHITGDLLQPILTFDLNIPDNNQTHNFLQYLATNPDEKRRQIIHLLLFNRFAPVADFGLGATESQREALVSNLDDALITEFVNEFLAELDDRLFLDIDLTRQTMSVSYSFMEGRLQLLREAYFTQSQQPQNDPLSIIGVWNIDYALSQKRNWYLRAYFNPRNTQDIEGSNINGRVSLRHSQRFGKLFQSIRRKKRRKS